MARLLNYSLYQIGWLTCVLGAAMMRPWVGCAIAILLIGIHLTATNDRLRQCKLVFSALLIGLIVDAGLLNVGVYKFPGGQVVGWLAPPWMTLLWIQFATTTRYCLSWLSKRYVVSALFGLVGAPLAFIGGESLGAITFLEPRTMHMVVLGFVWSAALPLLILVSDRLYADAPYPPSYRVPGWPSLRSASYKTLPSAGFYLNDKSR